MTDVEPQGHGDTSERLKFLWIVRGCTRPFGAHPNVKPFSVRSFVPSVAPWLTAVILAVCCVSKRRGASRRTQGYVAGFAFSTPVFSSMLEKS